jgi:hypothetical protein
MFKDLMNFVGFLINPEPILINLVDNKPCKDKEGKFLNTCPATGGICMNPLCLIGCIED